jgi:amidohydrolase
MSESWLQRLDQCVDDHFDDMVTVRRHLHRHPEPSGEERETAAYLADFVEQRGLPVHRSDTCAGLWVDSPSSEPAGRIALRADIDALRIQEDEAALLRSERSGVMHACGHDAHSAILMGALLGLNRAGSRDVLPAPIAWRALFQPAEETLQGANQMMAAGVLEGVDGIFAVHIDPTRDVGRIGLRATELTANCDNLWFTVVGRGGHAARPHEAIDPIAAAAQLITTLYLFVPRATDSQDAVVLSIGQVTGGENPNVIPEQVVLAGTIRTLDDEVRTRSIDHIRQLVRGLAETSGTTIDLRVERGVDSVYNDPAMTALVQQAAAPLLGEQGVEEIARPSMGSEDFAMYLRQVPGAMFRVGCASAAVGSAGLHSSKLNVDDRALAVGAKVLARAAALWSASKNGQSPPPGTRK